MNSELFDEPPTGARLRELFHAAGDLEGNEREQFLNETCAGQPQLRQTLLALLAADKSADSNLIWGQSALNLVARTNPPDQHLPFETLGHYRILKRIGTGGMGIVYLAEGDYDGVRKTVAIKVMPYAFDEVMIRRFRQERRIVASLEHPNIARMLDAGTTNDGVPYLVMEYVDGVPLNRYASAHNLSVDARLKLFRTICLAVGYAHRNLIVHRDLKPDNILVSEDGIPKLLDFGIARLLGDAQPEVTGIGLMTKGYASPEQLAGLTITTASDIYSLGVILCELLTGEKPGSHPRLDGDLGNVVSMALRQEPERRYSSAVDFAEDVRRVMEHYPVLATPDSAGYRIRRFIARRPMEVGVVLTLATAVVVVGVFAIEQYWQASRRFNEVRAIANSFLFEVYDSIEDLPAATGTRMVVAKRAQEYLDVLARDRSSDLALRGELAAAYRRLGDILGRPSRPNLGDETGALANYRKAAGLLEAIAASRPEDGGVLRDLGEIYGLEGRISIRRGNVDEALIDDDKSVGLLDRAATLQPGLQQARIAAINASLETALAHLEVGGERIDLKNLKLAEAIASEAKATAARLLSQDPGSESLQVLDNKACEFLAFAHAEIGVVTDERSAWESAARNFEEEVALSGALYARNPQKYRRALADAWIDVSNGRRYVGDARGAEEAAREGLKRFEEIAATDPDNREAAFDVLTADLAVGRALAAGHRGAEAMPYFEKYLAGEKQAPGVQMDRATVRVIVQVRDEMAEYFLSLHKNPLAIAQYRINIEALSGAAAPAQKASLALEYAKLGEALSSNATLLQAAALFDELRDSGRLPPRYTNKAAELRCVAGSSDCAPGDRRGK